MQISYSGLQYSASLSKLISNQVTFILKMQIQSFLNIYFLTYFKLFHYFGVLCLPFIVPRFLFF